MMEFENQEYQELEEFEDPEEPKRNFGGMSPVEIGILVVLLLLICGLAGFVGKSLYDNSKAVAETPPPPPTSTFTPTIPADATSTPWPTVEPIPEWNKFEFAQSKASLWMPKTFQGGDPIEYPEIVRMTIETYSSDEVFIESVDQVLSANSDITFFAFDAEVKDWARLVAVSSEKIDPDLILNMDAYLAEYRLEIEADGDHVVGTETVVLDYFKAGRVIVEFKVPVDDVGGYTYVKAVIYLIPLDDTLWAVVYRTGRSDFPDYWPIIKESINTFHAQP